MPSFDYDEAVRRITQYESLRPGMYIDSKGHPTVGIGFNLDRGDAREKLEALGADYDAIRSGRDILSADQIDRLFRSDIDDAVNHAKKVIPAFDDLEPARQFVVVDMVFNMGPTGFNKFTDTIADINRGDWDQAAEDMTASLWHGQVGDRAVRDVEMMQTGTFGGS